MSSAARWACRRARDGGRRTVGREAGRLAQRRLRGLAVAGLPEEPAQPLEVQGRGAFVRAWRDRRDGRPAELDRPAVVADERRHLGGPLEERGPVAEHQQIGVGRCGPTARARARRAGAPRRRHRRGPRRSPASTVACAGRAASRGPRPSGRRARPRSGAIRARWRPARDARAARAVANPACRRCRSPANSSPSTTSRMSSWRNAWATGGSRRVRIAVVRVDDGHEDPPLDRLAQRVADLARRAARRPRRGARRRRAGRPRPRRAGPRAPGAESPATRASRTSRRRGGRSSVLGSSGFAPSAARPVGLARPRGARGAAAR